MACICINRVGVVVCFLVPNLLENLDAARSRSKIEGPGSLDPRRDCFLHDGGGIFVGSSSFVDFRRSFTAFRCLGNQSPRAVLILADGRWFYFHRIRVWENAVLGCRNRSNYWTV